MKIKDDNRIRYFKYKRKEEAVLEFLIEILEFNEYIDGFVCSDLSVFTNGVFTETSKCFIFWKENVSLFGKKKFNISDFNNYKEFISIILKDTNLFKEEDLSLDFDFNYNSYEYCFFSEEEILEKISSGSISKKQYRVSNIEYIEKKYNELFMKFREEDAFDLSKLEIWKISEIVYGGLSKIDLLMLLSFLDMSLFFAGKIDIEDKSDFSEFIEYLSCSPNIENKNILRELMRNILKLKSDKTKYTSNIKEQDWEFLNEISVKIGNDSILLKEVNSPKKIFFINTKGDLIIDDIIIKFDANSEIFKLLKLFFSKEYNSEWISKKEIEDMLGYKPKRAIKDIIKDINNRVSKETKGLYDGIINKSCGIKKNGNKYKLELFIK